MTWVFADTGFRSGAENMAYDEQLAVRVRDGLSPPTLRAYGWAPPAISVGFNQDMGDFDADKIRRSGMDIVRRPTGGRAILHGEELTYSVAMPLGNRSPRELYRWINMGLLRTLELLGIQGELTAADDDFRSLYRDPASIPCFSTSARSEIHVGGRKLVGSAQRRFGAAILQHGSLLLGPSHRRIAEFLAAGSRRDIEDTLALKSADAETLLGRKVEFAEAVRSLRRGFQEACGIEFVHCGD